MPTEPTPADVQNLIDAIFRERNSYPTDVGRCPQCGGYLRTVGGNYADDCQYDECEDCDFTSDIDCP